MQIKQGEEICVCDWSSTWKTLEPYQICTGFMGSWCLSLEGSSWKLPPQIWAKLCNCATHPDCRWLENIKAHQICDWSRGSSAGSYQSLYISPFNIWNYSFPRYSSKGDILMHRNEEGGRTKKSAWESLVFTVETRYREEHHQPSSYLSNSSL